MRWRVFLTVISAWILTVPLSLAHAEPTLQQRYLDIYLKINDADHLEKQGDFRGALEDFKDCYTKLAKIHASDPDWEQALVTHRMADCQAKIIDLEPRAAAQPLPPPPPTPVAPEPPPLSDTKVPPKEPDAAVNPTPSDDVAALKLQLQQVQAELRATKESLKDSQAQNETYRAQVDALNAQLAAVKNQQTVDDRMGKLLSENKALSDKLAAAQKEIDTFKSSPKAKLALVEAQLKNVQDEYDDSQAANKALQDTTTTLKQQLDQANADLVSANQKLAAAGTGSPEYETLKRENEIMRDILTRELQEQAHRDMAKRLAQEEFDNLKLKSKVLQEQLDILGSPMTPPTNDQERQLLASLKVSSPDVTQPHAGNTFSAPAVAPNSPVADTPTNPPTAVAQAPSIPAAPETNVASVAPATTNIASVPTPPAPVPSTDNQPPVTVVSTNPVTDNSPTNTVAAVNPPTPTTTPSDPPVPTPPTTAAPTTTPDPSAPIPPSTPIGAPPPTSSANPVTPPIGSAPDPNAPTTTQLPAATTVYQDTTIKNGGSAPDPADPTQYSKQARLPDDMRDTAQQAADYFKNQRYDDAAADYQSIIDKYPGSLYAWSNLGVVRFQQGKLDEALKALQQAVKLSPTDAFSYSNLGIVYYQMNQYENAIDALNSAKALDPNDAKTHNYLGCACSQKGWQEVAEKEFRKAIELDPNFGDAHFNLALVYATSKPPSLELARREYNRALELGIAKDPRLEKLLNP